MSILFSAAATGWIWKKTNHMIGLTRLSLLLTKVISHLGLPRTMVKDIHMTRG